MYSDFNKQNNTEDPKFKVGDNIRISRYRKKVIFQIGLKKYLLLKELKILYRGHMLLVILKVKKLQKTKLKNLGYKK